MQLGFKCPRGYINHDECRRCAMQATHPCGLPPDLLELMREENSGEPNALAFTPSRLLNLCDRQTILMGRTDYYTDLESSWSLTRGNMVHALMEDTRTPPGFVEVIREVRLSTQLDIDSQTIPFTGKSDFIGILRQEGNVLHCRIVDYKTTKYIKAGMTDLSEDVAGQKYILQVNMYKWLVEKALPAAINREVEVVVDELEIVFFDMSRVIRFTSVGDIEFGRKTYKALPMYDASRMERWIIGKIRQKLKARAELPPVLPEYPTFWACQRCPVKEICTEIKEQEENDSQ